MDNELPGRRSSLLGFPCFGLLFDGLQIALVHTTMCKGDRLHLYRQWVLVEDDLQRVAMGYRLSDGDLSMQEFLCMVL